MVKCMTDLINGRTPEQILFNVMECAHGHCLSECPYDIYDDCTEDLLYDALTLIEHLEAKETTLNTLRDAIYEDAVAHGLWESADYNVLCGIEVWKRVGDLFDPDEAMRGQAMQIIRSEVDELDAASDDGEKYAEELSDVIIAALSVAGKLGIDIDAAVRRKMEINKVRPWKHGKKDA